MGKKGEGNLRLGVERNEGSRTTPGDEERDTMTIWGAEAGEAFPEREKAGVRRWRLAVRERKPNREQEGERRRRARESVMD